jgi:phosphoenolpyruvate phosphomutase
MTLLNNILPENRRGALKALIEKGQLVRVMEAHSGLSGIVANNTKIEGQVDGRTVTQEFDAIWESSLTDSSTKGHPDIEVISFDSRFHTIQEILAVTNKPMIVDGDTGGDPNNFEYTVSKLEKAGVSAVIIEDKVFPKRNSLESGAIQTLEDPDQFAQKIRRGKKVQTSKDFMIIARLESLIAGLSMENALERARTYLMAGADGIMIHSKSKSPDEILEFSVAYKKILQDLELDKPLICVPTTYNSITEDELKAAGFSVVIHANHLLRAAYKTMLETAKSILLNQRSLEADPLCAPVREIFKTVGFLDVKEKDEQDESNFTYPVIIPAAGEDPILQKILGDKPKAMLEIAGKTLLERQANNLCANNLTDITVITGYAKDKMKADAVTFHENPDYKSGTELQSIFSAEDKLKNGFIMLYSDILFEENIIAKLLDCQEDIVLVVDNTIQYHKPDVGKTQDLVISKYKQDRARRNIRYSHQNLISNIGSDIKPDSATHEFVGLAKFSKTGAEQFIQTYQDCIKNNQGNFHEAIDVSKASFTDMIQEMIGRGFNINYLEIHKGWMEIHHPEDVDSANKLFSQPNPSELSVH